MCLYIWRWCVSLLVGRARTGLGDSGLTPAHWQVRLVRVLVLGHQGVDLVL